MIQIHILIPSVQNLLIAQNYLLRRHFMVIWLRYLVFNGSVKWIREMKQQIKYEARSQPVEVTHHPKSQMTLRGGNKQKLWNGTWGKIPRVPQTSLQAACQSFLDTLPDTWEKACNQSTIHIPLAYILKRTKVYSVAKLKFITFRLHWNKK